MVEACGPVTAVAYRDRVAFMVRVRFVGAVPRMRWLDLEFWLTRRVEHRRFHKVETIYPHAHIHTLRVARPEELDDEVAGWIRESYAIGRQDHLSP
jgi:hypothetical protein